MELIQAPRESQANNQCPLLLIFVLLQVRSKALKTLNQAHTIGPRSTTFPLEDIVRMLMFRDTVEAADFIQQYGLALSEE